MNPLLVLTLRHGLVHKQRDLTTSIHALDQPLAVALIHRVLSQLIEQQPVLHQSLHLRGQKILQVQLPADHVVLRPCQEQSELISQQFHFDLQQLHSL